MNNNQMNQQIDMNNIQNMQSQNPVPQYVSQNSELSTAQTQPPKKSKKGLIVIIILLIIVVIGGVILFTSITKENNKQDEQKETSKSKDDEKESSQKEDSTNEKEQSNSENNQTNNENNNEEAEETNTITNMDLYKETLKYDKDGSFLFHVDDVFEVSRGVAISGIVYRGSVKVGDKVQLVGINQEIIETEVSNIEIFRESQESAETGDVVSIYLKDVTKEQVKVGQVIAAPNTMTLATKFEATIKTLSKEEGGRHTPFFANYRPQFYFRTADINGVIYLPDGVEMVSPGETVNITIELESPVALEVGTTFAMREGGRVIALGTVNKIS